MCIIVAKPAGTNMPTQKTLQECFRRNSDGAGFMILKPKTDSVLIDKGFMSYNAFKKALSKADPSKKDVVVMHFRITTSGGTCSEMCHPFPISSDENVIKKLGGRFLGTCFAHNGIISELNGKEKDMSDTAMFSRDFLSDESIYESIYESPAVQKLVSKFIGSSKLALLNPKKGLLLIGNFTKDSGVYYSNNTYKPYKTTTYYGGSYSSGYNKGWDSYGDYSAGNSAKSSGSVYSKYEWGVCNDCRYSRLRKLHEPTNSWLCQSCLTEQKKEDEKGSRSPVTAGNNSYECDGCSEHVRTVSFNTDYNVWLCVKCKAEWVDGGYIPKDNFVAEKGVKDDEIYIFCGGECSINDPCDDCVEDTFNMLASQGSKPSSANTKSDKKKPKGKRRKAKAKSKSKSK